VALPVEIGVVICGMTAVTWFVASTNQRHSAFSIPHFTFRIPQFRILPTAFANTSPTRPTHPRMKSTCHVDHTYQNSTAHSIVM